MKNLKKKHFLLIGLINLTLLGATNAQDKSAEQLTAYFNARITAWTEENQLIPYEHPKEINLKKIAQEKQAVWSIWKELQLKQSELPAPTEIKQGDSATPIHQWQLKGEEPMPFYFIQKGTSSEGKKALFLNLHGSGPKAMEFKNTLAWSLRFEDQPSLYFIPQIPSEKRYRWWLKPVQYAWEKLFREALVRSDIDPNRIYVMGISEGGYGSQRLGAFYADYLAGAGPMAGGEPLRNAAPLNYRNIALSLQTGENDHMFGRNELTLAAKQTFDSLAQQNPGQFTHQIQLQPNKGHGIDYTVTTPWLKQFSRNANPKHISWVLFAMDGRYRKGFYNIGINSPFPVQEQDEFNRVFFDLQYGEENSIYLQVSLMDSEMKTKKILEEMDLSIFVDQVHIDLSKKIKVFVNEKLVFEKKVNPNIAALVESCALFGDPNRLYPAKIHIKR